MSEAQAQSAALQGVEYQGGDFASLLNKEFKPQNEGAKSAVEQAVLTLAQQALSQTKLISSDVIGSIEAMIAALDAKMSEQVNAILHHAEFQQLESAWRGLSYLVNNTETDEMLKIRVFNISKVEVGKTLKKFKGTAWDQSPLFKKIYEEEYGQFGGEPFGCLVGDYYFDHTPPDVEWLGEMAKVSAALARFDDAFFNQLLRPSYTGGAGWFAAEPTTGDLSLGIENRFIADGTDNAIEECHSSQRLG